MVGTRLGDRYLLEEVVGAGGMATVYRALDETLERQVAVKVLHREFASDSDQLQRFDREAKAAAKISHAHIVTVVDAGEEHGRPYIVFEYVKGETLKQRIKSVGRLPVTEAVAYAIEIGSALVAAHANALVHRDVKPQNVLLDVDGHAKVADFGIARELENDGLTKTGRVLGTTDYVAPEQAMGEDVLGQSDVYSLGIVLFEMLTGEVPYKGDSHVAVAMKHVKETLPDVQVLRPEVSSSLAAVLERMTAKEPRDRYPDAAAAVAALEDVLAIETARAGGAQGEATTVFESLPKRSRRLAPASLGHPNRTRIAWVVALLASVGIVVLILTGFEPGGGQGKRSGGNTATGKTISLKQATAYDPQGEGSEHNDQAPNVIDGNPQTDWTTERYQGAVFPSTKNGVGIYVKTRYPVTARSARVTTPDGDIGVEIYGAKTPGADLSDWQLLGIASGSIDGKPIKLRNLSGLRYYLLWIKRLPASERATISEFQLRG
ncbi:MAG: serine/threonine protein kinase [Thermoleophilaceae bacterium]|nr:serine/threonine protein kinase [Thermoleophilaceae bacterium]